MSTATGHSDGGCFCGTVHYRLESEPIFVNCCHCRDCQTLGGSAFALNGMVEADRVAITKGADALEVQDGEAHCARCRVLLWAEHAMFGSAIRFVRLGTLDEGERFAPHAHFFVRSKHPWVTIPAGLPQYETLPDDAGPPLFTPAQQARVDAAMAGS